MKAFDIRNTSAADAAASFQKAKEQKEEKSQQKPLPEYKRMGEKGSLSYSIADK